LLNFSERATELALVATYKKEERVERLYARDRRKQEEGKKSVQYGEFYK